MNRTYNKSDVMDFIKGEKTAQEYMDNYYKTVFISGIDRTIACKNYDLVAHTSVSSYTLEEKFRNTDYGDILIELFQATEAPELGWYYHNKADYLIYVICNIDWMPKYYYGIRWQPFKSWFIEYLKENKFPKAVISPKGIGVSLNIAIPKDCIPDEIIFKREIQTIP